jgi:hypothetical protein
MEQGDPSVSIATYAIALYVFGMVDQFGALADLENDEVGQMLSNENLPKRIRDR